MNEFDLPQEEIDRILREMIIPQVIGDASPQEMKQAFILGGQPGSGKTVAAREILKSNPETVFVNADDLRSYHPKYYQYLKENDEEAADLTQATVRYWGKALVRECSARNLNVIVEGTMRTTASPLKVAEELKKADYHVNLAVLSVPYELSLLSIQHRYNESKKEGSPARFTKQASHDETYSKIEGNLAELSNMEIFDKFFVYLRTADGFKEYAFEPSQREEMLKVFSEGRSRIVEDREKELAFTKKKILNEKITLH
jgi:UDP-N-acetylglucosamine kinase